VEKLDTGAKGWGEHGMELGALGKQGAGASEEIAHQSGVVAIEVTVFDRSFRDTVDGGYVKRYVDSALTEVTADILPEIGQLESGAGGVRGVLAPGITAATEKKNEAAYGIRGIAAIGEDGFPGAIARGALVLAERGEEIAEGIDGDIEFADGGGKRDEHGMRGRAGIAAIQLVLPGGEKNEGTGRIAGFIADIVSPAAIGVDACEMRTKVGRKKPSDDVEILVVIRGEPANVIKGLGFRASWGRQRTGDLEAGVEKNGR
jgi:hypothetical protein